MPIVRPDYSNINHDEKAQEIGLKVAYMPILIDSFVQESTKTLEDLQIAIQDMNLIAIKEYAHSLKGSAGNLRFNEIYEMSSEMELSASDANDDFDYEAYLGALKEAITTIS